MVRSIVLLVAGLASLTAIPVSAQEVVLAQKYGAGVHAFFSHDYTTAYDQLTAAATGGTTDPRVFYFRGLAYLQLGRPQEAVKDFKNGAILESQDVNKFYNVSRSLERVQGQARVELETYRVEARMAALQAAERTRKARYEAIQREESRVLRELPPVTEPAAEKAADKADPFATPEAKETKPATPPVKPAAEPKKETKPAAEKEPAAEKKPAAEKEPAAEKKPATEKEPAAEEPPATEEQPATEEPPATDEQPAPEDKPADKESDPDNPFG